jgi:3-oxoacyl-[acyl-carrier protein] reductase
MIDTGLRDKVVLITGANHGIGAATASAFATQRASVFISYLRLNRQPEDGSDLSTAGQARYFARQAASADRVVQAIRDTGGRIEAWEVDLADPANVPRLFDRVDAAFGRVDVLVNNAAHCSADTFLPPEQLTGTQRSPAGHLLHTITAESHDRHFAVGATWGRIINLSTDAASAHPTQVSYGASKYALESYSHAAAVELGQYGITVNVVAPGPIQTGYIPRELEKQLAGQTPLRRIGEPADVADVIVFLASDQARWVTGQKLYVGGGLKMPL